MVVAVGIDIAKRDFEACLIRTEGNRNPERKSFANDGDGFRLLVSWAQRLCKEGDELRFCMESTGGYELALACSLAEANLWVSVENPRRIRHFGIARGTSNKTDISDARTIAEYLSAMKPRPWRLADPVRRELAQLNRHRESLIAQRLRAKNQLEHGDGKPDLEVKQLRDQIEFLQYQIDAVDERLAECSVANQELEEEISILIKLPGIGPVAAVTVVSEMPQVQDYERASSWAAQAGLFPCRRESGTSKGQSRMSRAGNAHVRRALYMGATQAMRLHPEVKALAERLKARGKKPMQIRVACMRNCSSSASESSKPTRAAKHHSSERRQTPRPWLPVDKPRQHLQLAFAS